MLQLMLQNVNISTMNLDDCIFKDQNHLDQKYQSRDNIGVPYGILLEDTTLDSGYLKLRNRDTTLHEFVHISRIEDYLVKLFNA